MALPVIESLSKLDFHRIWQFVCDPTPGRLGFALRMAAACTVTVLVCEIWQVPDLGVPALVMMAIWQKDRVTNALIGVVLNIIVLFLLLAIYGIVKFAYDNTVIYVSCIAAISFFFFFMGSASKLKPISYLLGIIIVFGLIVLEEVPVGEIITRAMLYTYLFTLVPGAVMIVLGFLICPSPRRIVTDEIAARLRVSAALFRCAGPREIVHATSLLRDGVVGMEQALKMARLEYMWTKQDLARLQQAANCSVAVLAFAEEWASSAEEKTPPAELIMLLEQMAAQFGKGRCSTGVDTSGIGQENSRIRAIVSLLNVFSDPFQAELVPAEEKEASGFFFKDAFSNPYHIRFAVNGTFSVLASYVLFRSINWPGIHTCIITCFIVALPTTGEMVSKLTLRIIGATIGGAIGILSIIYVMPQLQEITGFLVLVFIVSLLSSWIRVGDERIAYSGFQIGLAFYLSDLSGFGPTTDMATAWDRIVGVLIGNFITYAMFTSFWPSSAYDGLSTCMEEVTRKLRLLCSSRTLSAQAACMAQLQSAVSEGERRVEYALAEPPHMREQMIRMDFFEKGFADAAHLGVEIMDGDAHGAARKIAALENMTS
ncbi:MAG: FUSC family protein [Acetobacter sp.]|jgi:multidrug resistance protein MdtO